MCVAASHSSFCEIGAYRGGPAHRPDGAEGDGRGNRHPGVLGRKKRINMLQLPHNMLQLPQKFQLKPYCNRVTGA